MFGKGKGLIFHGGDTEGEFLFLCYILIYIPVGISLMAGVISNQFNIGSFKFM